MAITFKGAVQSVITYGNNATTQNLFVIKNELGSRVDINIRQLNIRMDSIAALASVCPLVKVSRAINISGGNMIAKGGFDSTESSSSFVKMFCPSIDSGTISATQGDTIWQLYCDRSHTIVEQQVKLQNKFMLPKLIKKTGIDFKIRPNESVLIQAVSSAGTSNASLTNNWFLDCCWEEDAFSTFTINGTVTLSAVPVSGAKVMVLEADDISMTNAILREVITTGGGGTWASSIRTGKVGAAFVQYENGGTYYTANGSPYLEQ
jgi:hypothetical protein